MAVSLSSATACTWVGVCEPDTVKHSSMQIGYRLAHSASRGPGGVSLQGEHLKRGNWIADLLKITLIEWNDRNGPLWVAYSTILPRNVKRNGSF